MEVDPPAPYGQTSSIGFDGNVFADVSARNPKHKSEAAMKQISILLFIVVSSM
jgi:hypothetical protein